MANSEEPHQNPISPPLPAAYSRYVSYNSSQAQNSNRSVCVDDKVPHKQATNPTTPETPLPSAYTRQLSFGLSKHQHHDPNVYVKENDVDESTKSLDTDVDSLRKIKKEEEAEVSTGKRKKSVLIFLRDSRFYIRVVAVLIMIVSLALILTAIISFAKAQKKAGNPLNNVSNSATITDHPCIVFSGVAAMNLLFSISILCLSCMSSKFNKSNNAINAVFTIISAIGFASSMSACTFLNKQNSLQNDLWKWSCSNHKKGIASDVIDFNLVCNVVSYGWKFGLAQAALELLTFFISVTAFILLKYSNFARYGRL